MRRVSQSPEDDDGDDEVYGSGRRRVGGRAGCTCGDCQAHAPVLGKQEEIERRPRERVGDVEVQRWIENPWIRELRIPR